MRDGSEGLSISGVRDAIARSEVVRAETTALLGKIEQHQQSLRGD
jgi:hypothetical protein